MKIVITEDQKKKLFIPRDLDDRKEQLNNDIKKFLISIKDSFVWDIVGKIYVSYNFDTDWSDISYYDKKGDWMQDSRFKSALESFHGEKYSIQELNEALDKITGYMDNLIYGGDNIIYGWCEITYLGDGHLVFEQNNEIKVSQKIREVRI